MAILKREIMTCERSQEYLALFIDGQTVIDVQALSDHPPAYSGYRPMLKLHTANHLRACPVCGSRKIGGCECLPQRLPCEQNMGFRFACVYCKNLRRIRQTP